MPGLRIRYVRTSSTAGGDGTVDTDSGANRAYPSMNAALAGEFAALPGLVVADVILRILHSCGSGSAADTTQVVLPQFTWDATHYVELLPNTGQEAGSIYRTTRYRLEVDNNTAFVAGYFTTMYFRVGRIQVRSMRATAFDETDLGMDISTDAAVNSDVWVYGCHFKGIKNGVGSSNTTQCSALKLRTGNSGGTFKVFNNYFDGWDDTGGANNIGLHGNNDMNITAYNNHAVNCAIGFKSAGTSFVSKNNSYDRGTCVSHVGFDGSFNAGSRNNASTEADSPGSNPQNGITPVYIGGGDYKLAVTDVGMREKGVDLSADATIPFAIDINGVSRPQGPLWDIGPAEADPGGGPPGAASDEGGWTMPQFTKPRLVMV